MSLYLQIIIGASPIAILFILLSVFSKKSRISCICAASLCMSVIAFGAVEYFFISPGEEEIATAAGSKISVEETLRIAYALAENGQCELAEDALNDIIGDYSDDYALCGARIAALGGDYDKASALYLKVRAKFPDKATECDLFSALSTSSSSLYSINADGTTGTANGYLSAKSAYEQHIAEEIDGILEAGNAKKLRQLASFIAFADESDKLAASGKETDKDELKSTLASLDKLASSGSSYNTVTSVRLARLKLQILCGNYKSAAQSISDVADEREVMIISELYLSSRIGESSFSADYASADKEKLNTVYTHLNALAGECDDDMKKSVKSVLDGVKEQMKIPALTKLENSLIENASKPGNVNSSKLYVQAAKVEHYLNRDEKVWEYLDRSIDSVGDCDDISYTAPMYSLIEIITDKDNSESLKNTAEYVESVLDNTLPMQIPQAEDDSDDEEDGDSFADSFATEVGTYVNEKRMSINIVNVDTSDFEKNGTIKVTANINSKLYTSAEELAKALKLTDCGVEISDFKVEKVEYDAANILFCVDVSGSMSGSKISDLKDALNLFISGKSDKESIALMPFSYNIDQKYPFGTDKNTLLNASNSLYASGGTAIYRSMCESIKEFSFAYNTVNSIILMSDGQDNYAASADDIRINIGDKCNDLGITVYSIGFGTDADSEYLSLIASSTNGAYLMANSSDGGTNQLSDFFANLRSQILNQYVITFTPKDTLTYTRTVKLQAESEHDSDSETYHLGGGSDSGISSEITEDTPIYTGNVKIGGFYPSLLYKNGKALSTELRGTGFEDGKTYEIVLSGRTSKMSYKCTGEYKDGNTLAIVLPNNIGVDCYDVQFSVDGKSAYIEKGLSVMINGSQKVTQFGAYRFVSDFKNVESNTITLSGNVTMNGWLIFNGSVKILGDLTGKNVTLEDYGGSYVKYDKGDSQGLAAMFAKTGCKVHILPLGLITLYNDSIDNYDKNTFTVQSFPLDGIEMGNVFTITDISAELSPNKLEIKFDSLNTTIPYFDKLINKGTGRDKKSGIKKLDLENSVIAKNAIGISGSVKFSTVANSGFHLGNQQMKFSGTEFTLEIDTYKNKYKVEAGVNLGFIGESDDDLGLSLTIGWNNPDDGDYTSEENDNGIIPTEISIKAKGDKVAVPVTIAGIPCEFNDFNIGISNIDTSKSIFYWTLEGGASLGTAKISTIASLDGLDKWIGDVSLFKLDDMKIQLCLGEFYLKASTTAKLFDELKVGAIEIELGKFSYTNKLLGLDDENVWGFRAAITKGPDWRIGNIELTLQVTGELDLLNSFLGLQGSGELKGSIKLWIIDPSVNLNGQIAIGYRRFKDGSGAFIIWTEPELFCGNISWPKNAAGVIATASNKNT